MKMFLYVFEVCHSCWILLQAIAILLQKVLARLFGDSYMSESFGVVSWNNADPSNIVKLYISDSILVFLISAFPDDSSASAVDDTTESTIGSAFFKPTILRWLSKLSKEALLTLLFLRMNVGGYFEVLLCIQIQVILSSSAISNAIISSSVHKL